MTRCAYCGCVVSDIGPYNPMSGEPICAECAESPAYLDELARQVDDYREALEVEARR